MNLGLSTALSYTQIDLGTDWIQMPQTAYKNSKCCFISNDCDYAQYTVDFLDLSRYDTITMRPRQNGRHFADDIFNCIFLNEDVWIPIKISLKFVPNDSINNIPALIQIKAWRPTGDKPLSEPMMTQFNDAYMRHSASMSYLTNVCASIFVYLLLIQFVSMLPRQRKIHNYVRPLKHNGWL